MGSPSIPTGYHVDTHLDGGVATHLDGNLTTTLAGAVHTDLGGSLTTNSTAKVIGDPAQPLATLLIGDPARPIATDSKVEILNLPRFTLQDIKDMMKVRVRIPNYSQMCFKIFGQEIFSLCINGEGQVITEPYVPNALERCEGECCEPDTRPFPGDSTDTNPNPTVPGAPSSVPK
jgi:hypothetical protein